jgi:hypothetical protein
MPKRSKEQAREDRPPDPGLMLKEAVHEGPVYSITVRASCDCCSGHGFELDQAEYVAAMQLIAKMRGYAVPELAHATR